MTYPTYPTFSATDLIREMRADGVRPANSGEHGRYWRSCAGHTYWVVAL